MRMFISEMRPDQRPRERLLSSGTKELTDAELLAIILGKGTPQAPVLDIAHHLLSRFGLARLAGLCSGAKQFAGYWKGESHAAA